jgi:uncharacterized repeat protein (TIGR01451 family)
VEGSRWNQAIEIYNGTGGPVNLTDYRIQVYKNGVACTDEYADLGGTLADGNVLIIRNNGADLAGITGAPSDAGASYSSEEGFGWDVDGGGIENEWVTLNLEDVIVENNSGSNGASGVMNHFGTMTVSNSIIRNNTVSGDAGGLQSDYGDVTITDSQILDNAGQRNGGLANWFGTMTIVRTLIEGNDVTSGSYDSGGGGVYIDNGTTTIIDSTIRNNTQLSGQGGGGILVENGILTMSGTTVNGNDDLYDEGNCETCQQGGGINLEHFGTMTITNSTISGNTSLNKAGGVNIQGRATFEHVTVYNNTAPMAADVFVSANAHDDGPDVAGDQPGPNDAASYDEDMDNDADESGNPARIDPVAVDLMCYPNCYLGTGVLNFRNTVIANTVSSDPCDGNGNFNSQGYNFVTGWDGDSFEDDADCGADQASDQTGDDPMLGALADNGGPTETHEPQTGSPLIDQGLVTEAVDQRRVFRPRGATSDVGSVEVPATDGYVQGLKTVDGTFEVGEEITYTIVLTNYGTCTQPNDVDENEFTDVVPSEIDVTNASADSGTATVNGNTVTWNGSILAGDSVTITITGTIVAGGTISNSGTVNYDSDCNGDNDTTFTTGTPAGPGPTTITVGAVAAEIPTLSWTMLLLLVLSLAAAALLVFRGRLI